jgi:hypothetical protein
MIEGVSNRNEFVDVLKKRMHPVGDALSHLHDASFNRLHTMVHRAL